MPPTSSSASRRRWRATTPPTSTSTSTTPQGQRGSARPRKGFASGWVPAHPTFYVKRHVADAVGPFDVTLATSADYEWMLRAIAILGASLRLIPHVLADMAIGGRSTSGFPPTSDTTSRP